MLRSREVYEEAFGYFVDLAWEDACARARIYADSIAAFDPEYLEELEGLADGAGLSLGDVLALNARTELLAFRRRESTKAVRGLPGECTALAAVHEATTRGNDVFIGQNWDWFVTARETVVLLEVEQESRPSYVTMVEAGLLAKTGMNSAGLGVATNALETPESGRQAGIPYHVLLRALLDQRTVSDAVGVLARQQRASSGNYLIAHESGAAINVEAEPGDMSALAVLLPERGLLVHGNHFLTESPVRNDLAAVTAPCSFVRTHELRRTLDARRPLDERAVQEALRNHTNAPASICRHPDPCANMHEQDGTIVSLVMELRQRVLWLAAGAPCESPHIAHDYSGFLGCSETRGRGPAAPHD